MHGVQSTQYVISAAALSMVTGFLFGNVPECKYVLALSNLTLFSCSYNDTIEQDKEFPWLAVFQSLP